MSILQTRHAPIGALAAGAWLSVAAAVAPAAVPGMVESAGSGCNAALVERSAWKMGTRLRATVCADSRAAGLSALDTAFRRVDELEARLSTWRPDSELSRLNAAPAGSWVELSAATTALLVEVRRWTEATGGAFDPATGAAVDAWDLRGEGRSPAPGEIEAARRAAGLAAWELDAAHRRARREPGVRLDAGAFGKGAALRDALAALREAGVRRVVLDFGGQMVLWSRDAADRWPVAVADPERRDVPAAVLRVGSGSVATTAASERFVETTEGRAGHVIDPRLGRPVPAWGSVTVVAEDPVAADVLSTALFVMGREEALAWSRTSAGAGVLILEPGEAGPKLYRSDGLDAVASIELSTFPGKATRG